jgi:hypothetical protein
MSEPVHWGADVPVSMPQPLDESNPGIVPMDGFCFTYNGLYHDLSQADWARMAIPTFAPVSPATETVTYSDGSTEKGHP